jgi:hypothetical protein
VVGGCLDQRKFVDFKIFRQLGHSLEQKLEYVLGVDQELLNYIFF